MLEKEAVVRHHWQIHCIAYLMCPQYLENAAPPESTCRAIGSQAVMGTSKLASVNNPIE